MRSKNKALLVIALLMGFFVLMTLQPVAAAAEKGPIVIGVLAWMDLDVGKGQVRGAELAAEKINAEGGILGRKIKIVSADTKGQPDEGLKAFEYLVTREKVDMVTGVFADAVLAAILPRLEEYKIPLLTTGCSYYVISEEVNKNYDKYKGWFRVQPINDFYLGFNIVEFGHQMMVEKLGWKSIVLFREKAMWTEGIVGLIKEEFPKIGIEVKDEIIFPVEETNFSPYYRKAQRTKADCIFAIVAEAGVAPVLQYSKFKPNMPMGGIVIAAQAAEFSKDVGGKAANIFTINLVGHNAKLDDNTKQFISNWTKKYADSRPAKPGFAAVGTYWALDIYRLAAERAGGLDFNALVAEIEKTDYQTLYRIQFHGKDEKDPYFGMNFAHDVKYGLDLSYAMWTQWQGDDAYAIWPDKFAVRDYAYPDWIKK